jgi:hypothetical protein
MNAQKIIQDIKILHQELLNVEKTAHEKTRLLNEYFDKYGEKIIMTPDNYSTPLFHDFIQVFSRRCYILGEILSHHIVVKYLCDKQYINKYGHTLFDTLYIYHGILDLKSINGKRIYRVKNHHETEYDHIIEKINNSIGYKKYSNSRELLENDPLYYK